MNQKYQRRFFDEHTKSVNAKNLSRNTHKKVRKFLSAVGKPTGYKVLDAGCGEGFFATTLSSRTACEIVGIDTSHKRVFQAKERQRDITFMLGSITQIPFKNDSFDVVWASEVLHHVPPSERGIVLREMVRVARSPGVIALVEPNRFHPLMIAAGLLMKADRDVFGFSISNIALCLRGLGCTNVSLYPLNLYTFPYTSTYPDFLRGLVEWVEDRLDIPYLCTQYLIVAKA